MILCLIRAGPRDLGSLALACAQSSIDEVAAAIGDAAYAHLINLGPSPHGSATARGGRVVPQGVQVAVETEPGAHLAVPVSDAVRVARPVVAWLVGEHERLIRGLGTQRSHDGFVTPAMRTQHADRRMVQCEAPHLMRLGVLLNAAAADRDKVAAHFDHGGMIHSHRAAAASAELIAK